MKGWKVLKRFFSFIIGCLAVVSFAEPVAAAVLVPDLTAKSAIVMEYDEDHDTAGGSRKWQSR